MLMLGFKGLNIIILLSLVDLDSSEYDLIVIGGGSGGLACSKEGKDKKSTLNTKS